MEKPLILIADDAMFMRKVIKRALSQGDTITLWKRETVWKQWRNIRSISRI